MVDLKKYLVGIGAELRLLVQQLDELICKTDSVRADWQDRESTRQGAGVSPNMNPQAIVVTPYAAQYADPIAFRCGDQVTVHRADTEYIGWYWCTNAQGREGWVHGLLEGFDIAALSPSEDGFYQRLGWEAWTGPLAYLQDSVLVPTPEEQVMIYRLPRTPARLDLDAALTCDWRPGDVW